MRLAPPRSSRGLVAYGSALDSVGINRREVVNERVIQEKEANHPDPEPCEGGGHNPALEALDRGTCRLGIPKL